MLKNLSMLAMVFLISCSAIMVQDVRKTSKYAPSGYKQTGIVKYLNQGADVVIEARREDAFKQMYGACGGPEYEILNEGNHVDSKSMTVNNLIGGININETKYMYLEFKCKAERMPAEATVKP